MKSRLPTSLVFIMCLHCNAMNTASQLESFYESNGGENAFHENQRNALEALLYGQDELEAGQLEAARIRVDRIFTEMPLSSKVWRNNSNNHGVHLGKPVAYYGLRMLDQILTLNDPSGQGTLQMTVVVARCAEVLRPTLPDLAPEIVQLEIAPEILADDAEVLIQSTKLFRHWLQAITGGYEVKLVVHIMDECTTVDFKDDGKIIRSYPTAKTMIDSVPADIAKQTNLWWVIAPSGVPGDGSGYDRHFITGGMGTYGPMRLPLFLSDDGWFIRKLEHLGKGTYSEIERRAYQPQWFQHEFMHHLYRIYPEFELEKSSHQWFDRSTWPEDFKGTWEPDYYSESLTKRLLNAQPSIVEKLKNIKPVDLSDISLIDLVGSYERRPVENNWHKVTLKSDGKQLRWENEAGVKWALTSKGNELWTGKDCNYGEQQVGVELNSSKEINAILFNGGRYERVSP